MTSDQSDSRMTRRDLFRLCLLAAIQLPGVAACAAQNKRAAPTETSPPLATSAPTAMPTTIPAASPSPTHATTMPASPVPAAASPQPVSGGAPDTILFGAKVITVDAKDTITEAVAIKDGLVQAVGTNNAIRALASSGTTVIDLKGKTVTPGLIDPHCHLGFAGLIGPYYIAFMPPEVKTVQDLQARLADVVAQTPPGEWIAGIFLALVGGVTPSKDELDPVSPQNPVWLMQQGGHYGSANSLALKLAGIDAATPNPSGGIIARDANGEPNGIFYNHRAMDLLRRNMPPYTGQMLQDGIASQQLLFAACGVTSFQDNNVRGLDAINTYVEAGREGKMLLRGTIYYTLEWPKDLVTALNDIPDIDTPYMRIAGYKFLLDGQTPTAYCHEPHNGVRWDMPTWEPTSFKTAMNALHAKGGQVCVHCIGDAAVDLTLDAYEEAMNASPRSDPRHRIEHCILSTQDATRHMKDLGVLVSTQPAFIRLAGDYWPTVFGPQREKRLVVTREWLSGGVTLALGSDAPTGPWYTPQMTMAEGMVRRTLTNRTLGSEQELTVQEALRAHTMSAAYAAHEETIKGSIEVGKLADLAVWDEDLYSIAAERLAQTTINMTIVGGKVVYQAA